MKIAFTASLRGKKFFENQYKLILDTIEELGHQNISKDLVNPEKNKIYTDVQEGGREANISIYKKKLKDIHDADICVFECSTHSLAIGFMVQKSLDLAKPTIVLYYKDDAPYFLEGVEDDKLIMKNYSDENLKKILRDALDEAENQRDKRFNFFISPSLLTYLEQASKRHGVTKSNFIRNLILEHQKKLKKGDFLE